MDHLLTLDSLLKQKNDYTIIAFLDIKAAYDGVSRNTLYPKLRKLKLGENLINAIISMCESNFTTLDCNGRHSSSITYICGVYIPYISMIGLPLTKLGWPIWICWPFQIRLIVLFAFTL
jgi:vacuolar-type H+-ATPase subunit D/Vma8